MEIDPNLKIVNSIMFSLRSKQKLERDKAVNQLVTDWNSYEKEIIGQIVSAIVSNICMKDMGEWEQYHGMLQAMKVLIVQNETLLVGSEYSLMIQDACLHLLSHTEVRVRLSAGDVLGALCTQDEGQTYNICRKKVLEMIQTNLERELPIEDSSSSESLNFRGIDENADANENRSNSTSAAQIFHDTAGWKNLESSMKCLESMILGSQKHFVSHINQELLNLIFASLCHTNRFVRETGFTVCGALVSCSESDNNSIKEEDSPIMTYGGQLSSHLGKGLADNWSQVRLAASVATRKFLMSLPETSRETYFPMLLPRICLNRYYVAEGVRLYSQETWQQVTGANGKRYVEQFIDSVVAYYIEATEANNHAVREAACSCIAELGLKISEEALKPFVKELICALTTCFTDDSWPVRDAACLACGNFISCYPDECLGHMDVLFPLFFNNLQDNIPSVRQGAATALGNVVRTYDSDSMNKVLTWINESLKGVESQPSESEKYGDLETGPALYGVVKRRRDNDMDLHSNKQVYSCGSLAPKMGRGGCSDCRFKRPTQPWEKADGSMYLIGELSSIPSASTNVSNVLSLVADCCKHKHYTYHLALLETLCKTLPIIAKGLGKRAFKEHLHLFIDLLFYSLDCDNDLTSASARRCLSQLGQFLGPNILRGRIELHNPSYLQLLDTLPKY